MLLHIPRVGVRTNESRLLDALAAARDCTGASVGAPRRGESDAQTLAVVGDVSCGSQHDPDLILPG